MLNKFAVTDHPERSQLESTEVRTYSAGQTLPVGFGHFQAPVSWLQELLDQA